MTARQIIVPGAMPSRDANGRALPAKFRFYLPGAALTTVATVYTDDTLTTPQPFPILSDSAGRWPPIWADDSLSFDVGWSDQTFDKTIDTFLSVSPADDAVLASVALCDAAQAAAEAAEAGAQEAFASAALEALQAAAYAAAIAGAPFTATSQTSLTVGTGLKELTLDQIGKLFSGGQTIVCAETTNAGNQMTGVIESFDLTTGVVNVMFANSAGTGTHTDWTISLGAVGGVTSVAGLTAIITAAALKAALAIASADISDFTSAAKTAATPIAAALAVVL